MDLFLFTLSADYGGQAAAQGFDGLVVDWESGGKERRQLGHDTEINRGTPADLAAMRAATPGHLICRVDNRVATLAGEIEQAIDLGASEIWLPMVRRTDEVERCLGRVDGRAQLGVVVETLEAARLGRELAELPLSRVFFGLNDYCIDAGNEHLFEALVDGTVDRFREGYPGPFGVAGVTRPDGGSPIPQALLLAEMVRLGCSFGVARRTFRSEVAPAETGIVLARIREHARFLERRRPAEVEGDRDALCRAVRALDGAFARAPQPVAP